jgi:hypothetical protein
LTYVLAHIVRRAAVEAFASFYREPGFVLALAELQRALPSDFPRVARA